MTRLVAESFHKRQIYLCLPTRRRVRLYQLTVGILRPPAEAQVYTCTTFLISTHSSTLPTTIAACLPKRIDLNRLGPLTVLRSFGFVIELSLGSRLHAQLRIFTVWSMCVFYCTFGFALCRATVFNGLCSTKTWHYDRDAYLPSNQMLSHIYAFFSGG